MVRNGETPLRSHPPPSRVGAEGEGEMIKHPRIASPRWTPEEDNRLRRLAEEGRSAAVIAERLKRKVTAVWSRAEKLGIPLRRAELTRNSAPEAIRRLVELGLKAKGK